VENTTAATPGSTSVQGGSFMPGGTSVPGGSSTPVGTSVPGNPLTPVGASAPVAYSWRRICAGESQGPWRHICVGGPYYLEGFICTQDSFSSWRRICTGGFCRSCKYNCIRIFVRTWRRICAGGCHGPWRYFCTGASAQNADGQRDDREENPWRHISAGVQSVLGGASASGDTSIVKGTPLRKTQVNRGCATIIASIAAPEDTTILRCVSLIWHNSSQNSLVAPEIVLTPDLGHSVPMDLELKLERSAPMRIGGKKLKRDNDPSKGATYV